VNAFRLYSKDVHSNPLLPPNEQDILARRFARERDPSDAQRLVLANLRLVIMIAKSLGGAARPDLMDLVQEGNAGLMVAVERFDPGRGSKLSTYAAFWIRAFILRHMMETSHAVRTTTREGRRRFFAGTLPIDVRLDAPAGDGADDGGTRASRLDFFAGDDSLRPDVITEKRETLQRLKIAVTIFEGTLDARERTIFEDRLLSEDPRSLRQLGAAIDLSGERVRQVEQDMLGRLRALVAEPNQPQQGRAAA
jgi:RNA polymerase sigma-32 factor